MLIRVMAISNLITGNGDGHRDRELIKFIVANVGEYVNENQYKHLARGATDTF